MHVSNNTLLTEMTAGQLYEYLRSKEREESKKEIAGKPAQRRNVYGIKGIMQLFNVSNVTAQRYKAGIIKEAVSQCGRKIVVDADKALELFYAAKNQQ